MTNQTEMGIMRLDKKSFFRIHVLERLNFVDYSRRLAMVVNVDG